MGVSGMSSRSRSVSPSDRSPAGEVLHAHDARDSHICGVMVPFLTSVTACTGAPTHPESKAHATIASGKPLNSADFGLPAQRLYRSLPTALRSCSRLRHPDRESFSWGYRPTSLAPGSRRGAAAVRNGAGGPSCSGPTGESSRSRCSCARRIGTRSRGRASGGRRTATRRPRRSES